MYVIKMIIFLLLKEVQNYIVIKLKKVQKENYLETYSPEIFMDNAYNKYYTLLNIGTPSQLTEVKLNCDLVPYSREKFLFIKYSILELFNEIINTFFLALVIATNN